jgi:hypothetical protein
VLAPGVGLWAALGGQRVVSPGGCEIGGLFICWCGTGGGFGFGVAGALVGAAVAVNTAPLNSSAERVADMYLMMFLLGDVRPK